MHTIIILVTVAVSVVAFSQHNMIDRLRFNAYRVYHKKEYLRLVSHVFLHANWEHLIINMLVFWSFGGVVEGAFINYFGGVGTYYFVLFYFGAAVVSSLWSLRKHKDDYSYNAVGASGAVSAVLFASILFNPWGKVLFFGIIPIPGIIFGVLYLGYSFHMSRRGMDNIGHDAHFFGAIFGFIFPILLRPAFFYDFLEELTSMW